jgi:N-acyl-D-aspartate/D-glutamate deacylase
MHTFDLIIRDGTIVDGRRAPRFVGDVAVKDGTVRILGGHVDGSAARVIDADGLVVAPGFVDLHTHYDAQIRWDPWCTISGWHGVTSVVLGNCGFGFAPVRPEFRERSMLTMTRTEAIPYASMQAGMRWDWETIPEYLASLERAPKGVNVIQYMPTASLMTYVMGLEAAKSRPATDAERKEMQRLLREGLDAGLCGFSIQRLGPDSVQADFDGSPMVTDTMADEEILALAEVLRERSDGFIQITQGTGDIKKRASRSSNGSRKRQTDRSCTASSCRPAEIRKSMGGQCGGSKTAVNADCRCTRSAEPSAPGSRSRSNTGISTTHRPRGVRSRRVRTRRSWRRCAIPGCAVRWWKKPKVRIDACVRFKRVSAAIRRG